jgi:hypothetical protein
MKSVRAAEKTLASTFILHVYPRIAMDLSVLGISENAKNVKTERGGWTAPGPLSKIVSLQKSPKSMRHQNLPNKTRILVSHSRDQTEARSLTPLNLLRGN